jgi:hypothetical protein
LLKELEFALP